MRLSNTEFSFADLRRTAYRKSELQCHSEHTHTHALNILEVIILAAHLHFPVIITHQSSFGHSNYRHLNGFIVSLKD